MTGHTKGIAKQRQDPLRERYRIAANEAYIVDSAKPYETAPKILSTARSRQEMDMAPCGASVFIVPLAAFMIFPIRATSSVRRSPPAFIQRYALLRIGSKFLSRVLR